MKMDPDVVAYGRMVEWPDPMRSYLRGLFGRKGPRLDRAEESRKVWATFTTLSLVERLRLTSREPEWLDLAPSHTIDERLGTALRCLSLSSMRVWLKMGLVCKEWRSARAPYLEAWSSRPSTYALKLEVTWTGPEIVRMFLVDGLVVPVPRGVVAPVARTTLGLRWHDGSVTVGDLLPAETYAQTAERLGTRFPEEWDLVAARIWLFLQGRLRP